MIDLQKHIEYWKTSAVSDFETAEILIEKNKVKHGLFFCHLIIEKILKAHYVKNTSSIAPKTHDLMYLVVKSGLNISDDYEKLFFTIQKYQLEGRYPDYDVPVPEKESGIQILTKTKEVLKWLMNQL